MRDFKLSPDQDLVHDGYDLELVDSSEEVAQRVKTRCLSIKGEWVFDMNDGVEHYNRDGIHDTRLSHSQRANIFRKHIAGTLGVRKIISFDPVIDPDNHGMRIFVQGETIYSTVFETELTI